MLSQTLPDPDLLRPGKGEPALRWGVVGPGFIAGVVTDAMHKFTAQRVTAVGSRSEARAAAFASRHGVERAYGSSEALFDDDSIDVVYVATPASEHVAVGLRAIAAGKRVLIEKPIATSASDARVLLEAGIAAGVFVMEAMWSRYLPQTSLIRKVLADGLLGDIVHVMADHGQAAPPDPEHRMYRPERGGGALLDLGIYPIQLDSLVFGPPTSITATGALTESGVDAYATVVCGHGERRQSTLTTSMIARTPTDAVIAGTDARIEFDPLFFAPTRLVFADNELGGVPIVWTDPTDRVLFDGISWQLTALANFVGEGRLESPLHTHVETVSILDTIDEARRQIAL